MPFHTSSYSSFLVQLPMPFFFFFVIFLSSLYSSSHVYASFPISLAAAAGELKEAEALLTWKASLNNRSQSFLSSWFGDSPCNNWVGVVCHNSGGVTSLDLHSSGLRGTLHSLNFSSLPNLLTLNLYNNSLYGSIPSHISNLSKATFVDLSFNHFTGHIPVEVGLLMRSLSVLALASNNLTGTIPTSIGNLGNLTKLYLYGNMLSGSIPQEVGLLRSLNMFDLSSNNLTSLIPTSIGNLTNLTLLHLFHNHLYGSIPSEVGLLRSLNDLDLADNNLDGSIPFSIGNLVNLTILYLHHNKLSAFIPQEVGL